MKKILFVILLLIPFYVYAKCDSKVLITNLELNEKKGYVEELEPSSYECNNIKLNIKMYNKDDSIIYNLTIKNDSPDDIELDNNFESKSEYIVYKIEDTNLIVEKGKEKTFKLSATYTKQADPVLLASGTLEDNQVMNLSINTKEDNPNTTSSKDIIIMIAILILAIVTILLLVLNIRSTAKYTVSLIVVLLLIPITVYALTKFELKLEAKVVIAEPKEKAIEPEPEPEPQVTTTYVCKKATTLHTKTCTATKNGCFEAGYVAGNKGTTITYGTLPNGTIKAGDAYDCDVNNDGVYDSETERFYYVRGEGSNAVLIYYANMNGQQEYDYDSEKINNYGPRTAITYLPTKTEWSNPKIIAPGVRQIYTEYNGTTTTEMITDDTGTHAGGQIQLSSINYGNKAARLLTYQDVQASKCASSVIVPEMFDNCPFYMENVGKYESTTGSRGYWLENARSSSNNHVYFAYYYTRYPYGAISLKTTLQASVRPVITIRKSDIEP